MRARQRYIRKADDLSAVEDGWHFLVGEQTQIRAAADAVGFKYRHDPETGEYRHKASLILLTPSGQVSRYLHGVSFPPQRLQQELELAAGGVIASSSEQSRIVGFLLNCFSYSPNDHTSTALLVMRVGGIITLLGLLIFLCVYGVSDLRRRRKQVS